MSERYPERAKRVFFIARYEANQLVSWTVETERLLLGCLAEAFGWISNSGGRVFGAGAFVLTVVFLGRLMWTKHWEAEADKARCTP